jgi:hypothetical protein
MIMADSEYIWTCPECGEENSRAHDECGRCGTSESGDSRNEVSTGNAMPLGVRLITVYTGINAVMLLLGSVMGLIASPFIDLDLAFEIALLFLVGALLNFVAVYGLMEMTVWGHSLTVTLYIVGIMLAVIMIIRDPSMFNVIWQVLFLALYGWILAYLVNPQVKEKFGAH